MNPQSKEMNVGRDTEERMWQGDALCWETETPKNNWKTTKVAANMDFAAERKRDDCLPWIGDANRLIERCEGKEAANQLQVRG